MHKSQMLQGKHTCMTSTHLKKDNGTRAPEVLPVTLTSLSSLIMECVCLPFLNFISVILCSMHFPDGASGKELACQCRRYKRHELDPWVGKSPWRRAWQPTPVFLPRESHGQSSWGHKELGMTKVTYHACTSCSM